MLDQDYQNGEFRFFTGDVGGPVNVALPQDVSTNFIGSTDSDPEVYSYMSGAVPRALACIVTTNFTTGTSTGKYFVYEGNLSTLTWTRVSSTSGIQLQDTSGSTPVPVAGNPYGVAQAGDFLYINDYDTQNIYTINIPDFETAVVGTSATTYPVDDITRNVVTVPPTASQGPAAALIALTNSAGPTTYLYSLYNFVTPSSPSQPTGYVAGQVNRFTVDTSTGALTANGSVTVGENAQALVPVPDGSGGFNILVPAIGGIQQAGFTNGSNSNLYRINAFGTMVAMLVLTGDGNPPTNPPSPAVTVPGNYDIKSVAASASGDVWLLLVTNDTNYKSWWKLYKTTMATLLAYTAAKTLTAAAGDLTLLDAGVGSPGYYWEVLFENSSSDPGRLWFTVGTPIRVSAGDNYDNTILFDAGVLYTPISGNTLYSLNLNSADLVGEMIYQYQQGNSIDTRLVKGKSASSTAAGAAAAEEEEEK
jgi:hypothetical protein